MSTSDTKYISNVVLYECFGDGNGGKVNTKLRKLRRQIIAFRACCSRPDCEPEPDPERFPQIAPQIREFKELGKTRDEMIDCAMALREMVEMTCDQSKARLNELLRLHTRNKAYKELYHRLESEISNSGVKLDPDDLEIILDAHDLALMVEGVILVTGDLKHIVAAESTIRRNTKIYDVQYLEKYTPS